MRAFGLLPRWEEPTRSCPVAQCYSLFSISLQALLLLGALALFVLLLKVHHEREAHGICYGAIEASSREKVGGIEAEHIVGNTSPQGEVGSPPLAGMLVVIASPEGEELLVQIFEPRGQVDFVEFFRGATGGIVE